MSSTARAMVDLERLVAAAKAIRDQADIRFEIDGIKAIDAALLTELTEAVEDTEQNARHLGHGPAPLMSEWRPVVRLERACSACDGTGRPMRKGWIRDLNGQKIAPQQWRSSEPCPTCHGTGVERGEALACGGCKWFTPGPHGANGPCRHLSDGDFVPLVKDTFACASWEARE